MHNGRKAALRKISKKTGIARPKHGRNRSNRRKGFLAAQNGEPSPVIVRERRARKKFAGRRDKGR